MTALALPFASSRSLHIFIDGDLVHLLACAILLIWFAQLAASRDRSMLWGLLGPLFWTVTSIMFWSLSGADIYYMSVVGGVFGAIPAYAVVYALESHATTTAAGDSDEGATAATTSKEDAAATTSSTCPNCGSDGRPHGGLLLCTNTTCNAEFFAFEAS